MFWIWASNRSLWNSAVLIPLPCVELCSMNLGKSLSCCLYQKIEGLFPMVSNVHPRLSLSPWVAMTTSPVKITLSSPSYSGDEQKM